MLRCRNVFVLYALLSALSASSHSCFSAVQSRSASFAGTCAPSNHVFTHGVTVYACLLRAATTDFRSSAPLPSDPLTSLWSPDALVGRLSRDGNETNSTFVVSFGRDSTLLQRASGLHFLCTVGRVAESINSGLYRLTVLHEFANWDWDPPWNRTGAGVHGLQVTDGAQWKPLFKELQNDDVALISVHSVRPSHLNESHLPQQDCMSDFSGRWLNGTYLPHGCRLRRVSYPEFEGCMARLGGPVYVVGDSNIRRSLKSVLSGGEWCRHNRTANPCTCEDLKNGVDVGADALPWNVTSFDHWAATGVRYDNGSYLQWIEAYSNLPVPELGQAPLTFQFGHGAPRLLVLGDLGAWNVARLDLSQFVSAVRELIRSLRAQLDPSVKLIFRTSPFLCCSPVYFPTRRFSSKRADVMASMLREMLMDAFPGAGWWDTRTLSAARPLSVFKAYAESCLVNHMDSETSEEDSRLFMHLVCTLADA